MTTKEFKERYPQYKSLEGDTLWDMMTEVMLQSSDVLTADPNREMIFHEPFKMNILQDDGTYVEFECLVEDESKTRWLNNRGEVVKLKEKPITSKHPTESYSYVIWDAQNHKK